MNDNDELKSNASPSTAGLQGGAEDAKPSDQPALFGRDVSCPTEGFSVGTDNAEALSTIIEERRGAVDAARAVAQLNADWLARIDELAQQLDDFYRPEMSSTSLSYKDRVKRTKDYVKLQSQLFDMFHTANLDYLQCHGIYRDRVSMLAEAAPATRPGEEEKTVEQVETEFKELGTKLKEMRLMRRLEEKREQSTGIAPSNDPECKNFRKLCAQMMVEKNSRLGVPLPGGDVELPELGMDDSEGDPES